MRTCLRLIGWVLAGLALMVCASATTLQKLSLDEMIQQSTGIVRAKVIDSRAALRGQSVYTYYRLQILETPKGTARQDLEVAIPGGTANGIRQIAVGAPELTLGSEYVMFLWTGKSGLTQIVGLSQGLFQATKDSSGAIRLNRAAAEEPMVDNSGHTVSSGALALTWGEMRARIRKELGK